MSFGEPKVPTPEEMAKIHAQRVRADSGAISGGASYTFDSPDKDPRLEFTEKQKQEAKLEMDIELGLDIATEIKKKIVPFEEFMSSIGYSTYSYVDAKSGRVQIKVKFPKQITKKIIVVFRESEGGIESCPSFPDYDFIVDLAPGREYVAEVIDGNNLEIIGKFEFIKKDQLIELSQKIQNQNK